MVGSSFCVQAAIKSVTFYQLGFFEVSVTSMNSSQLICTLFSFRSFENLAAS